MNLSVTYTADIKYYPSKMDRILSILNDSTWKKVFLTPVSSAVFDLDNDAALVIDELLVGNRFIMSNEASQSQFDFNGKLYIKNDLCYVWVTNDERRRILRTIGNSYNRSKTQGQLENVLKLLKKS